MIAVAHPMMTRSECNVGWLIFLLRPRRRQPVRHWRAQLRVLPRLTFIAGGCDLARRSLSPTCRGTLGGRTPVYRRQHVGPAPGHGTPVPRCGLAITKDAVDCEVEG